MRLIVTEKNNSAKKIAEILSGGTAKEESSFKTPYYTWDGDEGRDGPGDRDRLRPRGRADRPGGPSGGRRGEPSTRHGRGRGRRRHRGQARPLLGSDQGRDPACVRQPRRTVHA